MAPADRRRRDGEANGRVAPPRGQTEAAATPTDDDTTMDVLRFMRGLRSFWHLAWAGALHAFDPDSGELPMAGEPAYCTS